MPVQEATELIELTHAQLIPPADNVRRQLTDIAGLADTIFEHGLLQPLLVSMGDGAKKATIVAGARRHAAIGLLIEQGRLKRTYKIRCVRTGELDDQDRVVAMLVENLQRADLNPIEEAAGYQRLIDEFGFSRQRVCTATGRSKTAVQVRLALLKLAPQVQEAVAAKEFALDLASRLAVLPAEVQEKLVARFGLAGLHAYRIDEAEREVERQALADRFTKACEARGITPTTQAAYQLTPAFTIAATVALKDLPGALLPDDLDGAVAQLDYSTKQVTVWLPREDTVEADDLAEWRAECDRIRDAHHEAARLYREQTDALAGPWARKVPAKMIHEAALRHALHASSLHYFGPELEVTAKRAGFERSGIFSSEEASDELADWLDQPSNLLATAALMLLKKEPHSSFARLFDEHVLAELGPAPRIPDLPARPGGPAFTDDVDDEHGDELDEDAPAEPAADTDDIADHTS